MALLLAPVPVPVLVLVFALVLVLVLALALALAPVEKVDEADGVVDEEQAEGWKRINKEVERKKSKSKKEREQADLDDGDLDLDEHDDEEDDFEDGDIDGGRVWYLHLFAPAKLLPGPETTTFNVATLWPCWFPLPGDGW